MNTTPTHEEIEQYLNTAFPLETPKEMYKRVVPPQEWEIEYALKQIEVRRLQIELARSIFMEHPGVAWRADDLWQHIAHDIVRAASIEWCVENGEIFSIFASTEVSG